MLTERIYAIKSNAVFGYAVNRKAAYFSTENRSEIDEDEIGWNGPGIRKAEIERKRMITIKA